MVRFQEHSLDSTISKREREREIERERERKRERQECEKRMRSV